MEPILNHKQFKERLQFNISRMLKRCPEIKQIRGLIKAVVISKTSSGACHVLRSELYPAAQKKLILSSDLVVNSTVSS